MEKFYSKIEPNKLLHVVFRKSDMITGRINILSDDNFIQCASLNLNKGTTFKAHRHIWKKRSSKEVIAQESWIVIQGKVRCIFYDIDNEILAEPILEAGDASFTLDAGHNYVIEEDNSLIMEYKTGPYEGQQLDKYFI